MNKTEFLQCVVPDDGYLYVGWLANESGQFHHKVFDPGDYSGAVSFIDTKHKQQNVYYAMASFKEAAVKKKNGRKGPSRKRDNVKSLQALWLDIDVGDGKSYATKPVAVRELVSFCKKIGLPPSLVVDSGGGVHAYWLIDEPVTPQIWKPVAEALKAACAAEGLQADPACTADAARVLRPLGTLNHKHDAFTKLVMPKDDAEARTYSVSKLSLALGDYTPRVSSAKQDGFDALGTPSAALQRLAGIEKDLEGGTEKRPTFMANIIQHCGQMRHMLDTNGQDADEPLWKDTLLLAAFCKDGEDYAHKLSNGHPDYTVADTAQKFAEQQDKVGEYGPTLCSTFEGHHPAGCEGCPFRGNIKSPVVLGLEGATAAHAEEEILMPRGYRMADDRRVFKLVTPDDEDEDETWEPIDGNYGIEHIGLVRGVTGETLLEFQFRITDKNGDLAWLGPVEQISFKARHDQRSMNQCLGAAGMQSGTTKKWADFMGSYITQLQAARVQPRRMVGQYGWQRDAAEPEFVLGDTKLTPHGHVASNSRPGGAALGEIYSTRGDYKVWKSAADEILQYERAHGKEMARTTLISSAFAAPLMHIMDSPSVLLAATGASSGAGKTSAMRVAQAVWGDPKGLMQLDDTANSINTRLGILNTLPTYWDEVRILDQRDQSEVENLIMRLSQGRSKSRLNADASMQNQYSWQTMMVMASNYSLFQTMESRATGTEAGLMRCFELEVPTLNPKFTSADAERRINAVMRNYGHAGVKYADFLVQNWKQAEHTLDRVSAYVNKKTNSEHKYRFWRSIITALISGAILAKAAGVVDIDHKALTTYLLKQYKQQTNSADRHVDNVGPVTILNKFLRGPNQMNTMVTDYAIGHKFVLKQKPRFHLAIQYGAEDGYYRFKHMDFRDYIKREHSGNADHVINSLIAAGVLVCPLTMSKPKFTGTRAYIGMGRGNRIGPLNCFAVHEDKLKG